MKTDCRDISNCGVGGKIMREVTDTFISEGGVGIVEGGKIIILL